jgi:hypothetical protein
MDDQFLKEYRKAPRQEFARALEARIEGGSSMVRKNSFGQGLKRWSPALIAAALIVAAILVVTLPPTRALAQDFLNLFRVQKFATLAIDPARVSELEDLDFDPETLLSGNFEKVIDPGKPVVVGSTQEASERVGYAVAVPATLPEGAKLKVSVQGEGAGVVTADTAKLQELLTLVGVTDAQVPPQLDGAKIKISKPAAVLQEYTVKGGRVSFIQSPSPQVELPEGVELKQLGEIGLRVLGLNADEARQYADTIDWNSTFLIPVPANAGEVRQVNVNGADGLMLTPNGTGWTARGPRRSGAENSVVSLWARDGMVYGMQGTTNSVDLLEMANSVQ